MAGDYSLADSGSSGANAAAVAASPSDTSSVDAQAVPNEPRNPSATATPSGADGTKQESKSSVKSKPSSKSPEQNETDDEEYDLEGEKVKRSELFERFKRSKEFERASHKRMQDAAEQRKAAEAREREYEQAFQRLQADPWAIHRARGWTDQQIAEAAETALVEQVKRSRMTPEQIQAEQERHELLKLRQENENLRNQKQQETQAALKQRYIEHFDQQIGQAMETGKLARTAATAAKVAGVIAEYLQAGERIEPAVAAQIVRDNHHTEIRHEFTELRDQLKSKRISPERFSAYVGDLIGDETVKLLQQSAVKKAQDFEPQKPASRQTPAIPKGGFDSFEEANKWIDKKIGAK